MSHTPKDAAIRVDAALEEKLKGASFQEITEYLKQAAIEQSLVVPQDGELIATPLADNAPKRIARTVIVNGVKHIVEGVTETELLAAETAIYKQLLSQPKVDDAEDSAVREHRRDEAGRFAAAEEAEADHKALQAAYQEAWKNATNTFLSNHPEWEGGEQAKTAIGKAIIELGLQDAPTIASLELAYRELRRTNALPANEELRAVRKQHDAIANAGSFDEIRRAAGLDTSRGYDVDFRGEWNGR